MFMSLRLLNCGKANGAGFAREKTRSVDALSARPPVFAGVAELGARAMPACNTASSMWTNGYVGSLLARDVETFSTSAFPLLNARRSRKRLGGKELSAVPSSNAVRQVLKTKHDKPPPWRVVPRTPITLDFGTFLAGHASGPIRASDCQYTTSGDTALRSSGAKCTTSRNTVEHLKHGSMKGLSENLGTDWQLVLLPRFSNSPVAAV